MFCRFAKGSFLRSRAVSVKQFLTGDTHGDFTRFKESVFYEQAELTKEDIVLICGDFADVWYGNARDDKDLDWLEGRPFTTVFVAGNRDNYDALRKYPLEEWRGGNIRRIRPSVILLERSQIFDLGGKRFFAMGGASSHDIQDGILEPDDPLFKRKRRQLDARWPAARRRNWSMPAPPSAVGGGRSIS